MIKELVNLEEVPMETRVAIIAIIAESRESANQINTLLHEYGSYIIGRMGLPYRKRGINIISIVVDAPQDKINTMAGKIGRIKGVTAKTVYSNVMN
jgi:putative iron-only hydrogenase system regulator